MKRFFTFFVAVWALLSISQTGKAADVTVYFQCPSDWTTPVHAYAYNSGDDHVQGGWSGAPAGSEYYTSTGVKLWKCTFDSKYKYVIFKENTGSKQYPGKNKQGLEVKDNYVYTFGGTSGTSLSEFENGGTTPSKFAKLYVWGDIYGSAWGENDFSREFTTSDGKTYKYVFGTDYTNGFSNNTEDFCFRVKTESKQYAPPTNDDPVGTEYTSAKESSEGAWKLTMTKGKSYTLIFDYENKQIMYSEEGSGIVTPPTPSGENPIANRKYSEGYYLVGNFFNFDGNDINYDDAVFKFQQVSADDDGNAIYSVEIPATLTAKAQVMSVDALGNRVAVYGPGKDLDINNTYPEAGADHTATTGVLDLTLNTRIDEDGNYWNMSTRRTSKDEGGQDGSYTYKITIDKLTKLPTKWEIYYTDLKRVAYILSTEEDASANTLSVTRKNIEGNFDSGKMFGSVYVKSGSKFYGISNAALNDCLGFGDGTTATLAYPGYNIVRTENGILPTYPKLFLWGHGDANIFENVEGVINSAYKIAPNWGTFVLEEQEGLSNWEFDFNRGTTEIGKAHGGMSGDIQKYNDGKVINSLSMVGPAIPGTMDGEEWNWASKVGDMTYDASENCYKLTLTTSANELGKAFRFVGNHDKAINWHEDGLTEDVKAKIPYDEAGDGHSATAADRNKVSYTEENANPGEDYHIVWNRPAGTWTVKFYKDYVNESGQVVKTYTYSISENHSVALKDFEDVSYKSNVRNIRYRGSYRFFRTFSDTKAWKCPEDVHIYVVEDFIPAKEATATTEATYASYKLTEINKDSHIIPEKTGVILATANKEVGVYSAKTDPNYYNLLTINLTEVAKDASYDKPASKLEPLYVGRTLPSEEDGYYNYLFGFYNAKRIYPETYTDASLFLLGFWISNGTGVYNSNGAYMKISKEQAKGMRLGTSYEFVNGIANAKLVPALLFDFANANETTGINMVKNTTVDDKYYTLSGVQVAKPSTKGIYIHNGKKIVIK